MLLAMALASGFALLLPVLTKGSGLDPQAMVQLMNRDKAVVIDVCEPDEFARSHVIGAKNLPLGQLEDKLAQVVKNKSAHVIMVCQGGERSARAAATARSRAAPCGWAVRTWLQWRCTTVWGCRGRCSALRQSGSR
jgi:rhodanese-related sulfurtransferase